MLLATLRAFLPRVFEPLRVALDEFGWSDLAWSAGALLGAAFLGRALAWLALSILRRWARGTQTVVDDLLVKHMSAPIKLVVPIYGMRLASAVTSLPASLKDLLAHGLLLAAILGTGWVLLRAMHVVEDVVRERFVSASSDNFQVRAVYTQVGALRNIVSFLIVTLTIAFALTTFDSVRQLGTGLLASAGVAGVVIGFAAQRSIATVVAGLQLAFAQPIRVEDVVIVEGEWGRVEEITLTYVVVRIWDLRRLIVPITYFIERPFQNWTRSSAELLGTVELNLDYSVPVDAIREELSRILEETELWNKKNSGVQVTAASERAMTVRILVSAADASQLWDLRCLVRERMIAFVAEKFPGSLPKYRTRTEPSGEPRVVSS